MGSALASTIPLYPGLIFLGWLVHSSIERTPAATAGLRFGALGLGLVLVTLLGFAALLGRHRGAALVGVGVLVAVAANRLAVVCLIVFVGVEIWGRLGRRPSVDWSSLTRPLNGVTLAFVAAGALMFAAERLDGAVLPRMPPLTAVDTAGGAMPDIVIVMLDGYPRADTLQQEFGYDNSAFLTELEERGFDVATQSQSNYMRTELTLASVLNAAHVSDLMQGTAVPEEESEQVRLITQALQHPRAVEALEDAGYESTYVAVPLPHLEVGLQNMVRTGAATTHEIQLLRHTAMTRFAPSLLRGAGGAAMRQHVVEALDSVPDLVAGSHPSFVFAHLLSPHAPFVFSADGTARNPESCFPATCDLIESSPAGLFMTPAAYNRAYTDQTAHLNDLLLEFVDKLLSTDPTRVVVMFSDHGSRYDVDKDPDEAFHSLFVSHTPGASGLFGDSPTPVNLMPALMNQYLRGAIELLPSTQFWSEHGSFLTTSPWE